SLSREMEFQADRVSVRLAGSQAMCDVLYQLGPISQAMEAATQQLGLALEHGLATDDVFYHQTHCLREQLAARPAPAATATAGPQRRFSPDEVSVVAMYASHPADYLREAHAQQVFVPGPTDERSPWLLFEQPAELRKTVTQTLYSASVSSSIPAVQPAAQVEAFLAAERAELEYADHYAGTYDNRLVTLLSPEEVARIADDSPLPAGSLLDARTTLYGAELRQRTEAHTRRIADLQKLALFQQGRTKDRSFVVDGQTYPAAEATAVTRRLELDARNHTLWLEDFDRQVLAVHWRMLDNQPERRAEWKARFEFQHAIQIALRDVREAEASASQALQEIEQRGSLQEADVAAFTARFEQSRFALQQLLQATSRVPMLPLTHLSEFSTLTDFVLQNREQLGPARLSGEWVNAFFNILEIVKERLRRLYFKNLGVLLRLEEAIAQAHAATPTAAESVHVIN
ncbi:MAG TPA: hypothetical protein VF690_14160, partial [Hymenobacter sp.]